jgi:hypothetical protein
VTTFSRHANGETSLEATKLAAVAELFVDVALPLTLHLDVRLAILRAANEETLQPQKINK